MFKRRDLRSCPARRGVQTFAGGGQLDAPVVAAEQRHARRGFQRLDLPAHRRLGDEQLGGGARKAQMALGHAVAAALTVISRNVWVTQHGRYADHVLLAGQALTMRGNAALWLSVLSPACLSVDAGGAKGGMLRRLGRNLLARYLWLARRGLRRISHRSAQTGIF